MPHSDTEIEILNIKAKGIKKNKTNQKYGVKTNQKFCFFKKLVIKEKNRVFAPRTYDLVVPFNF